MPSLEEREEEVVKNKEEQIVTINEVKLNNISLKIKEFGNFKAIDNAYVDDYKIQTNVCSLNGEWHFELLQRDFLHHHSFRYASYHKPIF